MAGLSLKFLYLALFLGFMMKGISGVQQKCSTDDIWVKQIKTGVTVHGKPQFQVTLFNACSCPQINVKLACKGFTTAEKIDPKVLIILGEVCSVPKGYSIAPFSGYVFKYAWDAQFPFKTIYTKAQC